MVYWITGKKNAGKTTLAYRLKELLESYGESVVVLDGGGIRGYFPIGYSETERWERTYEIGKWAAIFEKQGVISVVALLSEKKEWRERTRKLFNESRLIYLPGGVDGGYRDGYDGYEVPGEEELRWG
jgi:adenylylsulfate kinase-like enzyme